MLIKPSSLLATRSWKCVHAGSAGTEAGGLTLRDAVKGTVHVVGKLTADRKRGVRSGSRGALLCAIGLQTGINLGNLPCLYPPDDLPTPQIEIVGAIFICVVNDRSHI